MSRATRILTLPDIHEPYNINLKPILNFCSDWNPDVLQYLGDVTNAESVNPFKIRMGIMPDVESVKQDFNNLEKNVLIPFDRAKRKGCEVYYYIGNHELWFYQVMLMDRKLKGMMGVEDNIDLKKYNMELVGFNKTKKFGHLHFMHGIYINQYHSAKTCINYGKNMRYGHTHDVQSFMMHSPIDVKEKKMAQSIGCLCHMGPGYMKNQPNKWANAFNIAYVRDDGTFNDYTIIITDGEFTTPDGKLYK